MSALLGRLDAWHRGTPVREGAIRYAHSHIWRRRECDWMGWQAMTPRLALMPPRFMVDLSVEQRAVLGFPGPGDGYWDVETVEAVGRRYEGMDMAPYAAALAPRL